MSTIRFLLPSKCPGGYTTNKAQLRPNTSLVLDSCRQNGNIDVVNALFSKGLASARDVNSEGSTPLHASFLFMLSYLGILLLLQYAIILFGTLQ